MSRKPTGGLLVHAEGAPEVQLTLGEHPPGDLESERGGHRAQRHPGAGHQRFQQHVAGAQLAAVAAGRGCSPASAIARAVRTRQATPLPSSSPSACRVIRAAAGSSAVAGLQRGLDLLERGGIHPGMVPRIAAEHDRCRADVALAVGAGRL